MKKLKPLERAIEFAGGQSALARALGIHQTSVWGWLKERKGVVPAKFVEAVSEAVDGKVTPQELRPDLF